MIDSHIHLTNDQYENVEEVVSIALANGVEHVVCIGCNYQDFEDNFELQKKFPDFISVAIGWHPVDVKSFDVKYMDYIEQAAKEQKICAIGEIGLDYHWYPEQKEEQIVMFEKHLVLAKKYDLPIIIHAREAYEDTYDILKKYAPISGIMHSFADCTEMANKFIDLGLEIGISGPITFKNGQSQKDVAAAIDLKKLHIETDGPYLTPVPFRGKVNRPEYIKYVAQEIAFQKKLSVEEVLMQTKENTKRLFKIRGANVKT